MKAKLISLLRAHWRVLVCALVLAALLGSPLYLIPHELGSAYKGVDIVHFGNDEHGYLVRGEEVLEGHGLGQIYLSDGKDTSDPTFSQVERFMLFPFTFFHLHPNIVTVYNAVNTIAIFFLALVIYAFVFAMSGDSLLAAAAAVFVIGGYSIIEEKSLFFSSFNIYGRSVFPFASSIPFFGFLLLTYEAIVSRKSAWYSIVAGVILGALFYDYFYAWTFAAALLATLFVVLLVRRDIPGVMRTMLIGSIGIVLGLGTIIPFLQLYASQSGGQLSYFLWSVHGRTPIMSLAGLAGLLIYGLYWWRMKGADKNSPFILACIVAGWIALNQQLITGSFVQYGHYYWYFIVPVLICLCLYMVGKCIPRRLMVWVYGALIALAFVSTAGGQYQSVKHNLSGNEHDQSYASLLSVLASLPRGTILTGPGSDSQSLLVPIYTDDDLYWYVGATTYHTSFDRIEEALLVYLYLNHDARKDPIGFLQKELSKDINSPYSLLFENIEGYRSGLDYYSYEAALQHSDSALLSKRPAILSEVRERYAALLPNDAALRALLLERGVTYVLWDSALYPEGDLSPLQPLTVIATSTDLTLYKLQ